MALNKKYFKIVLLVQSIIFTVTTNAQISYNGSFEYTGNDNKTLKWFYELSPLYNVTVDSVEAFKGSKSLHVASTSKAANSNRFSIFQAISLSGFKNVASIKVIYHTKITMGNENSFECFVSPQQCVPKRSFRKTIHWKNAELDGWKSIQANISDTLNCDKVYIGFVVAGILDIHIDEIEIFINGEKINDLPIVIPPPIVPGAKEMEWLKNNVVELSSVNDYERLGDLSFLRKAVGDAKVIGLGESTHGTKEFNTLRGRIIKYLVDSMNFQLIVFENDIIPTQNVNELLGSSISSRAILDSLFGRIHQSEEIAGIFDYIREKNRTGRKVIIEGCDMQGFSYATKSLLRLLKAEDTLLYNNLKEIENYRLSTKFTSGKYDTLYKKAIALYGLYKSRIKDKPNSRLSDLFVAKQMEAIRDSYYFNYIKYLPASKGGDAILTSTLRDSLMSENIFWLMKNYPNKKIIIWAHDGHVKRGFYLYEKYLTMGNFLNARLGNLYKAYSFTTGNGIATGYVEYGQPKIYKLLEPAPDTYEYYFDKTGVNTGFLNLELTKSNFLKNETIVSRLKLRSIGYNYTQGEQFRITNLAGSYSGIFYIRNSTNSASFHFQQKSQQD